MLLPSTDSLNNSGSLQINRLGPNDLSKCITIERQAYPIGWSQEVFLSVLQSDCETWGLFVKQNNTTEKNDNLVGYLVFSCLPPVAHIYNLCISPDYQRSGYAKILLTHLIERLKGLIEPNNSDNANTFHLQLEVRSKNEAAKKLYESLGFEAYGERSQYYREPDGSFDDAYLYQLEIKTD